MVRTLSFIVNLLSPKKQTTLYNSLLLPYSLGKTLIGLSLSTLLVPFKLFKCDSNKTKEFTEEQRSMLNKKEIKKYLWKVVSPVFVPYNYN